MEEFIPQKFYTKKFLWVFFFTNQEKNKHKIFVGKLGKKKKKERFGAQKHPKNALLLKMCFFLVKRFQKSILAPFQFWGRVKKFGKKVFHKLKKI